METGHGLTWRWGQLKAGGVPGTLGGAGGARVRMCESFLYWGWRGEARGGNKHAWGGWVRNECEGMGQITESMRMSVKKYEGVCHGSVGEVPGPQACLPPNTAVAGCHRHLRQGALMKGYAPDMAGVWNEVV